MSSYARQFLGLMEKPNVELIEGLSPAISIDQKTTSKNPRSTVGTVTEIYDYIRLLYARIGVPHCPNCGKKIEKQTIDQVVDSLMELEEGTKIQVFAPVVRGRKGEYTKLLEDFSKEGFVRVRVDGQIYELTDDIEIDRKKKHNIDIAFDSIVNEVKTGKADFGAAGISYSPERAENVDFSNDYSVSRQVAVVRENTYKSVSEIMSKRIAVQLGSIGDTYVSEHFKDASVVRQKKYLAAAEDLKASKVDAIVMDELPAKQIILNNTGLVILDEEITSDSYGMIVKKGNKELLLAINKVIDRLKSEGKIDEFVLNHTEE